MNSLNIKSDISTTESVFATDIKKKSHNDTLLKHTADTSTSTSTKTDINNTDHKTKNKDKHITNHDHTNKFPPPVRFFTRKASLFNTNEDPNKYQKTVMKSKNNQSSFANNPTHSYSDQYYTNIGHGKGAAAGPRLPYGVYDPYAYQYGAAHQFYYPPSVLAAPPPPVSYVYPHASNAYHR